MLYLRSILFVCLLGAMSFGAATPKVEAAQSATVAWDKSPDASVVGYRVLVGTTSGGYTQLTDVQGAAGATVSNLNEGVTYYFAVIAYDAGFTERTSSNEVSYLTPGVPPLPAPTPTPSPSPSPTAAPVATPTPFPTSTPIATPTPTPNPRPTSGPGISVSAVQVKWATQSG